MQDVTYRFIGYDPKFLEGRITFLIGGTEFAMPREIVVEYFKNVKYYQMDSVSDIVKNYDVLSKTRPIPRAVMNWLLSMDQRLYSYMRQRDAERHQHPEPRKFKVVQGKSLHDLVGPLVSRKRKMMKFLEFLIGNLPAQMYQFNTGLLDHVNLANFKRIDGYDYHPYRPIISFEAYEFDITDAYGDCIRGLFFLNFYPPSARDAAAEQDLRITLASSPLGTFSIEFKALDQNHTWQSIDGPVRRGMKLDVQNIHGSKGDEGEKQCPTPPEAGELARSPTLERLIKVGV